MTTHCEEQSKLGELYPRNDRVAMNCDVRMVGRQLRCYRLIRAGPCENKAVRRPYVCDVKSTPLVLFFLVLVFLAEITKLWSRNRQVEEAGDVGLADVFSSCTLPRYLRFPDYFSHTRPVPLLPPPSPDNVSMSCSHDVTRRTTKNSNRLGDYVEQT